MSHIANQNELAEAHKAQRRKWGIPDDVLPSEYMPAKFGVCYFCKKSLSDYNFCYGCQNFVCETCDLVEQAGKHTVEEHRGNPNL